MWWHSTIEERELPASSAESPVPSHVVAAALARLARETGALVVTSDPDDIRALDPNVRVVTCGPLPGHCSALDQNNGSLAGDDIEVSPVVRENEPARLFGTRNDRCVGEAQRQARVAFN